MLVFTPTAIDVEHIIRSDIFIFLLRVLALSAFWVLSGVWITLIDDMTRMTNSSEGVRFTISVCGVILWPLTIVEWILYDLNRRRKSRNERLEST